MPFSQNPDRIPTMLFRAACFLLTVLCCRSSAQEESRNYPLGPIGGQFRVTPASNAARIVSLTTGAPGSLAGLQVGDYIYGAFGKTFTPTGSFHYGFSQDLGFAVDRAEAADGVLPLMVLRPGTGGITVNVPLSAAGAFGPVYPINSPKFDAMYESAVATLHNQAMNSNGNLGYFTGWTGLCLLGHPDWNANTGARPYRLSVNKIRDYVVGQLTSANYSPNEDKIINANGTLADNPNHRGGMSNWQLGQMVMFLAEYYAKTADAGVATTLQRGAELCSNSVQWWKQPDISGTGYSPGYSQIAGIVSHGGVTGDYIHLGWGGGINICGVYSFNGMAFARRAGMNMAARPRDGHDFGYDPYPATLMPVVPAGMENYDHTIDEKFLMQWNWMAKRCGGYSAGNAEDGHVCYTVQGWSSWDAGGRTPGTLLGMAMYKADGGTLSADDEDKLSRLKGYITRQYMKHQEAHAYCVGAQAWQALAAAYLSDRQLRYFMDNWRFYFALSRTHNNGFQYFRSRSVNDSYLDETQCAAVNVALPHAIANGRLLLVPGYNRNRVIARFDNPDLTWPSLDARAVKVRGATLAMPMAVVDGSGTVLDPAGYSLAWSKISGPGSVTFGPSEVTFSASGNYRIQLQVTRDGYTLTEPIDASVTLFEPPAGYASGSANYQVYTGISGTLISNLTADAKFPDSPDVTRTVTSASGNHSGDNYGARLSGAILPPVTGTYRFYIATDDNGQLKLNPSGMDPAGASVVATITGSTSWADANQWTKFASQQSAEFQLTAGQPIWFEALQKEGTGGDHLSVGWSINGGAIEVIGGANLAAAVEGADSMRITGHPQPATTTLGGSVTLSVAASGPQPAIYQWRRNGQPVGSPSTTATLTLGNVSGGAAGSYDCVFTTPLGTLTSNAAEVTLTDDGGMTAGGLWREVFTGIGGDAVSHLTSSAKFPNFSDSSGVITSAASVTNYADSYGQRWTGWLIPKVSGNYRFYLTSDDSSELWLSASDLPGQAARILQLSGYTGEKQWSARSPSAYQALVAGKRYYIELRHKEGGSADHCALAWQREGTSAPANGSGEIPGEFLAYRTGGIYQDVALENLPPAFVTNPFTLRYATIGAAYTGQSLASSVIDPNSADVLTFSKLDGPAWLTVAADGTLGGMPSAQDEGINAFTIRVTDAAGVSTDATLHIGVTEVNHPPVFAGNPLTLATASATLPYEGVSLAGIASDPDAGQSLSFSLVSGPGWLTVAADGALGGTPALANVGTNSFTVRVADIFGDAAETVIVIPVEPPLYHLDVNGALAGSGITGDLSWDGGAQWTTDPTGGGPAIAWLNGATAVFAAGEDAPESYTASLTNSRGIGGLRFRSGSPVLTGAGLAPSLAATRVDVASGAGVVRIDSPISGSNGIAKTGPGTLVLGGNHTFTGNLGILEGVLELSSGAKLYNAAWNNAAVITVGAGGVWRMPDYSYGGTGQLSDYPQRRVLDGGIIEVTGGTHSSGQNFTVSAQGGTIRYTPPGQTLTLSGNNNGNIQLNGTLGFDTPGTIVVSEVLQGAGGISKSGTGTLRLSAVNTHSGAVNVNSGTLSITAAATGNSSALGAGTNVIHVHQGATLLFATNNRSAGYHTGPAYLHGGTLTFNTGDNSFASGKTLTFDTAPCAINGSGQWRMRDAGAGISVAANASGTTISVADLKLTGVISGGYVIEVMDGLEANDLTISSPVSGHFGGESITKTGGGTLSLTGAGTYTGATTVSGGSLKVGGSLTATSGVAVGVDAALTGGGSIPRPVSVTGKLSPGDSVGAITLGALTLNTGSTLRWEVGDWIGGPGAGYDHVSASSLNLTPATQITVQISGESPANFSNTTRTFTLVQTTGGISGFAAEKFVIDASELPAATGSWSVRTTGNALELIYTPPTDPYHAWETTHQITGAGVTADADDDGVPNGIEFVIGGDPKGGDSSHLLPTASVDGVHLHFVFRRSAASAAFDPFVEYGTDITGWTRATPDLPGVSITEETDFYGNGTDRVTVSIPRSEAGTKRLFARLRIEIP